MPWDHSSLTGGFYFQPASLAVATETTPAAQTTVTTVTPAVDKEVVFWESIKNSTNPADFQAYLAQFPNGTFAELARLRVAAATAEPAAGTTQPDNQVASLTTEENAAAVAEQAERSIGLTRNGRSKIQLALNLLGYKTGGTDGRFGPKTRNAISAWQADRGEDATGYLTTQQHAALLDAAAPELAKYEAEQKRKAEIAAAEAKAAAAAEKKRQQQEVARQAEESKKTAAAEAEAERLRKENEELKKAQAAKQAEEDDPDVDVGVGIGIGGGGVGVFPSLNFGY